MASRDSGRKNEKSQPSPSLKKSDNSKQSKNERFRDQPSSSRDVFERCRNVGGQVERRHTDKRDDYKGRKITGVAKSSSTVRDLYEVPHYKNSIMKHLIKKPGHGFEGNPIKLLANFFSLTVNNVLVFHYDIEIKLATRKESESKKPSSLQISLLNVDHRMRRLALKDNMQIISQLALEWEIFSGVPYVYDGLKNLYSTKRLKLDKGSEKSSREVNFEFDGYRMQTYEVFIQYCQDEIDLSAINQFYQGSLDNIPQKAFQVLEIILNYMPIQLLLPVGRSLYSHLTEQEMRNNYVGEGAVMAYGHYQSVRLTEVGPAMVIDRKATVLHFSGTFIQFLIRLLPDVRNEDELKRFPFTSDGGFLDAINRHVSGLKIFTTHIDGVRRKYIIDKIVSSLPSETKFEFIIEKSSKETPGRTKIITIEEYFFQKYHLKLEFRNIPCILLKGGQKNRYIPAEICHVYPDQPLPRRLISKDITAQMVQKSGQQWPVYRFGKINDAAKMIVNSSKEVMKNFEVKMSINPLQVLGRVLSKPFADEKNFKQPKSINEWFFIILSPILLNSEKNMEKARETVRNMVKEASLKQIIISDISQSRYLVKCTYKDKSTIENIFSKALSIKSSERKKLQMIMFCIPSSNEIYQYIKYQGDMIHGVITQCVRDYNVMDIPRSYFTNLLFKMNNKLDGINYIIPEKPRILKKPSIVIGVDVTHPAPTDRMQSSVAACVGSYDSNFSKYATTISVQSRSREEIITEFGIMIEQLLTQFKKKNKILPEIIIIFRDGVSESQFETVLRYEYQMCFETCVKIGIHDPKITFVIVQKRHHTRFLPLFDRDGVGKSGNIPQGTVVDSTITNPVLFEYYLCSHLGLQGTSRPTKYVVIEDKNNITADEMQNLSYYMCFNYARCNKPISIPTPVQYAHLAAYRSKVHLMAQNIDTNICEKGESQEEKIERDLANAALLNKNVNVNEELKTRLYYC